MDKDRMQLINIKTLSKKTDLSVRQLQRLTKCNLIPQPMRLAGSVRWRKSDILLFLDSKCDMKLYTERKEASND